MTTRFLPTVFELSSARFQSGSFAEILASTPRYLGCDAMVPIKGSRHTTPSTNDAHMLFRGNDGEVRAFLNACAHRNAQLVPVGMKVKGNITARGGMLARNGNIICPWHRYTYDQGGELVSAPAYGDGAKPCAQLNEVPLEQFGGLIFEAGKGATEMLEDVMHTPSFAKLGIVPFDTRKTVLYRIDESQETFSALHAMEIFGDTDHVDDIHPNSFDQLVDMETLWLEMGHHWSIQFVGWRETTSKVCDEYKSYRDLVRARGNIPRYGAVWMMFGPNTTFEWYPTDVPEEHIFVVSTFVPTKDGCRNVVEWYVPEGVLARSPDLAPALMAAYAVTAEEDRAPCNSIERGRRALVENGFGHQTLGPIHPDQEGCVAHYYDMLKMYLDRLEMRRSISYA